MWRYIRVQGLLFSRIYFHPQQNTKCKTDIFIIQMRSREPEKKLKNHETLTPMKRTDSILFIFFLWTILQIRTSCDFSLSIDLYTCTNALS